MQQSKNRHAISSCDGYARHYVEDEVVASGLLGRRREIRCRHIHSLELGTEGRRSLRFGTEMQLCFELYIAKDRPQSAIDTTTNADSYSGKILAVQVHQAAWKSLAQQAITAETQLRLNVRVRAYE